MQLKVDEANRKTAAIDAAAREISHNTGEEIEQLRSQRDAEKARADAAIKPVWLCKSASSAGVSKTPSTSTPTDSGEAEEELPVRAGEDIGPALLVFAESCQRDYDDSVAWLKWWEAQQVSAASSP
jgi:hypothetical protein